MSLLFALAMQTALERPDARPMRPTRAWLIGTWLQTATKSDVARAACNSGTTYQYMPNGRTRFFEGAGRWRLKGRVLTETLAALNEPADGELAADLGRPIRARLVRIGPHEGVRIWVDGHRDRMLRCRPGDFQ